MPTLTIHLQAEFAPPEFNGHALHGSIPASFAEYRGLLTGFAMHNSVEWIENNAGHAGSTGLFVKDGRVVGDWSVM
jgi:hypothetical protein